MTIRALVANVPNVDPLLETICLGGQRMIEPEVGGLPGTI
jgi:hypothetical protein